MSTSKEFMAFLLDQLSPLEGVTHRMMIGEYIIYYQGRIAAYVCDGRLLVKPVPAARAMLPDAPMKPPYAGAKDMMLIECVEDGELLCRLFDAMLPELALPKPRSPKRKKTP